jgi:hypothetical protein
MLWGPTAFEVPHRPSRTGQSGWNESLPAGSMQVKSSARIFPRAHLNVRDLQSVCHWIVTLGIIRTVQQLFRWGGRCLTTPCVMPTKWQGAIVGSCSHGAHAILKSHQKKVFSSTTLLAFQSGCEYSAVTEVNLRVQERPARVANLSCK